MPWEPTAPKPPAFESIEPQTPKPRPPVTSEIPIEQAAMRLMTVLMEEMTEAGDGRPKTYDELTIEAWLWRQAGQPNMEAVLIAARSKLSWRSYLGSE